jgi:hypothetical protein
MTKKSTMSNDLLLCTSCHISVHRECYENICLALNVQINNQYNRWYCQRCHLKRQVNRNNLFINPLLSF